MEVVMYVLVQQLYDVVPIPIFHEQEMFYNIEI